MDGWMDGWREGGMDGWVDTCQLQAGGLQLGQESACAACVSRLLDHGVVKGWLEGGGGDIASITPCSSL
jgi:hypothetical protein